MAGHLCQAVLFHLLLCVHDDCRKQYENTTKKKSLSSCLDWHRLGDTGLERIVWLPILHSIPSTMWFHPFCKLGKFMSSLRFGLSLSHWITFFDGLLLASLYITDHLFLSIYVRTVTIIPAFPPAFILLPYLQAGATSSLSLLFNRVAQQASAPLLPGRLQSPFIPQIPAFHRLRPKFVFSAAKMTRAV